MDFKDTFIYLTRKSFCFADDVMAPNIRRYIWRDKDWCPEVGIFSILEDYLGPNLPRFYWRGYAGGKMIVDVNIHREDLSFKREIILVENWQELLRESRTIHFINKKYKDRESLPSTIDRNYYTYEEAEKLYKRANTEIESGSIMVQPKEYFYYLKKAFKKNHVHGYMIGRKANRKTCIYPDNRKWVVSEIQHGMAISPVEYGYYDIWKACEDIIARVSRNEEHRKKVWMDWASPTNWAERTSDAPTV